MHEEVKLARHEWLTIIFFSVMFLGLVSVTYEPFIEPPKGEFAEIKDTRIVGKKARTPRKTKTVKKTFEKIVEL
jgi:hypothetical protein